MLRFIVRIIILLCLFAGTTATIACSQTPERTEVDITEQEIGRKTETIFTGD